MNDQPWELGFFIVCNENWIQPVPSPAIGTDNLIDIEYPPPSTIVTFEANKQQIIYKKYQLLLNKTNKRCATSAMEVKRKDVYDCGRLHSVVQKIPTHFRTKYDPSSGTLLQKDRSILERRHIGRSM